MEIAAEGGDAVFTAVVVDRSDVGGEILVAYLKKAEIILIPHGNIDIVIPRNKTLMTDGAQQRAVVHPIIDVLFPTDMVEDPQKFPQFFF